MSIRCFLGSVWKSLRMQRSFIRSGMGGGTRCAQFTPPSSVQRRLSFEWMMTMPVEQDGRPLYVFQLSALVPIQKEMGAVSPERW